MASKLRISVLASHGGTTLQAIIDAIAEGRLDAELAVVISNNSGSGAMQRADRAAIPTLHLSSATHPGDALDIALRDALLERHTDVVFLAGYMKKLGPLTLGQFESRILNTHPALLPRFGGHGMYGSHVHRAVLDAKERVSGATVHLVTAEYDTGPVIANTEVEVRADDTVETLAERVQAAERALVVDVLGRVSRGEIVLTRGAVRGVPF
jgi:phosphoribosylglycinamide formyltransferase 1